MSIAAISFDAAGTLIHFADPVGRVYAEVGRQYGLTVGPLEAEARLAEAMRQAPDPVAEPGQDAGAFEYDWWRSVAAEVYGCAPESMRLQACFAELFHCYGRGDAWQVHDELPWLLQQLLGGNYRLAICSNFDARLYKVLDEMGLSVYFDVVVIPRVSGFIKPQPGMFVSLSQQLQIPPQQILHAGDHAGADVVAAARMGFTALQWALQPEADAVRALLDLKMAAQ